jgi:hypothetical protein
MYMSANKYGNFAKKTLGLSFALMGVAALTAGVAVNAQTPDDTQVTLDITAGDLTVTITEDTYALSGLTITNANQNTNTDITGINVVDLRGSNAGWTLAASMENMSLTPGNPESNVLMGTVVDGTDGDGFDGTSLLTLTNSNLSTQVGAPHSELALTAAPTFDSLTAIDDTGATGNMTMLAAEQGEGAGDYLFDTNFDIQIPAYGDYDTAYTLTSGKYLEAGSYAGTLTYTFI